MGVESNLFQFDCKQILAAGLGSDSWRLFFEHAGDHRAEQWQHWVGRAKVVGVRCDDVGGVRLVGQSQVIPALSAIGSTRGSGCAAELCSMR